jgi:MFS family permease
MPERRRDRIYAFFAVCYLAQGMTGIIYEPLSYLLKDSLGLDAARSAAFIWWMTLPMLLKPLFGLLSDLLPVGGRRRRPHMALSCLAWGGSLAALAAWRRPGYGALLALLIVVNIGLVLGDVVCDAVMVEQGQRDGKTGPYQAVQIGILYATIVVTGLGGGWLAGHATARQVFALSALFPLLALASVPFLREPAAPPSPRSGARALLACLSSKRFWAVSGLIFLWSFAPFLGTAQFYYESDALKLSPLTIGWLDTVGGLTGVLGAAAYGRLIGARGLRWWLRAAVAGGALLSLSYLLFLGPWSCALAVALTGLIGVAFRLALMDLAARACPEGAEAAAFAAYMAVFNLAASTSNFAGGWLWEALKTRVAPYGAVAALTLVGAACTAACWPLIEPALEGLGDDAPRAEVARAEVVLG